MSELRAQWAGLSSVYVGIYIQDTPNPYRMILYRTKFLHDTSYNLLLWVKCPHSFCHA